MSCTAFDKLSHLDLLEVDDWDCLAWVTLGIRIFGTHAATVVIRIFWSGGSEPRVCWKMRRIKQILTLVVLVILRGEVALLFDHRMANASIFSRLRLLVPSHTIVLVCRLYCNIVEAGVRVINWELQVLLLGNSTHRWLLHSLEGLGILELLGVLGIGHLGAASRAVIWCSHSVRVHANAVGPSLPSFVLHFVLKSVQAVRVLRTLLLDGWAFLFLLLLLWSMSPRSRIHWKSQYFLDLGLSCHLLAARLRRSYLLGIH